MLEQRLDERLAVRADVARRLADAQLLNNSAAVGAGLAGTVANLKPRVIAPRLAVHVLLAGAAARLDAGAQHVPDGAVQRGDLVIAQRVRPALRVEPRQPQRVLHVHVADTGNK